MSQAPKTTPRGGFVANVPNLLTICRMLLVPVFLVVFLLHPDELAWRIGVTLIFVLAMTTDAIDGRVARSTGQVTDFGKLWDPIADKLMTGVAFIALSIVGELPWWMTALMLLREWGITALRFKVLKYGVMAANRGGKLKTVLQTAAIIMFLLGLSSLGTWWLVTKWVTMTAAFALTMLTGIDYLIEAKKLRDASIAAGGPVDITALRADEKTKRDRK